MTKNSISIFRQLTEWQYYIHVLIIAVGLVGVMHVNNIHYFHSSITAFGMLAGALIVLDVIAHFVMAAVFGWKD
jgi:membrane protein YdbS with pleckstrin-like domain